MPQKTHSRHLSGFERRRRAVVQRRVQPLPASALDDAVDWIAQPEACPKQPANWAMTLRGQSQETVDIPYAYAVSIQKNELYGAVRRQIFRPAFRKPGSYQHWPSR